MYLRQDKILAGLDAWMNQALAPPALDATVQDLLTAPEQGRDRAKRERLMTEIAECDRVLEHYRFALEADGGGDRAVLLGWIGKAEVKRVLAQHHLAALRTTAPVSESELRRLIAQVPDMGALLPVATDEERMTLYSNGDLRLAYDPLARIMTDKVDVATLAWAKVSVRGGT